MALGNNNPQQASLINIFQGNGLPDGKGYQVQAILNAAQPSMTQSVELVTQGMVGARSIVIDNSQNPALLSVSFSNTTQNVAVQPYTTQILPFFGPKGPFLATFTGDGINSYNVSVMFSDAYLPPAQWQTSAAQPPTKPVSPHIVMVAPIALYPAWTLAEGAQATRTQLNVSNTSAQYKVGFTHKTPKLYISKNGVDIYATITNNGNFTFGVGSEANYLGAVSVATDHVAGASSTITDTY